MACSGGGGVELAAASATVFIFFFLFLFSGHAFGARRGGNRRARSGCSGASSSCREGGSGA